MVRAVSSLSEDVGDTIVICAQFCIVLVDPLFELVWNFRFRIDRVHRAESHTGVAVDALIGI